MELKCPPSLTLSSPNPGVIFPGHGVRGDRRLKRRYPASAHLLRLVSGRGVRSKREAPFLN
jgi:hypothetical protein